jgi:DNA repair exonuclease SbcCD nuclease subunit
MKLDIISDLHLDFWIKELNPEHPKFEKAVAKFIDRIIPGSTGETLIIAGDIGHYNSQAEELLKQLKEVYKYILIVHGNHDLYLISDRQKKRYEWESIQRVVELKAICKELDVYYLDGNVVEIEGVRIGGTCGWYDLSAPGQVAHWKQSLNDSNLIYDGYPIPLAYSYGAPGRPDWDTNKYYRDQLAKLKEVSKEGCDILVTHVAQTIPPDYALPPMYVNDPGNVFYYVDNFDLIKDSGCEYYIYGHTHNFHDWDKEEIQFLCNPLGYPQENNKTEVIQIEV